MNSSLAYWQLHFPAVFTGHFTIVHQFLLRWSQEVSDKDHTLTFFFFSKLRKSKYFYEISWESLVEKLTWESKINCFSCPPVPKTTSLAIFVYRKANSDLFDLTDLLVVLRDWENLFFIQTETFYFDTWKRENFSVSWSHIWFLHIDFFMIKIMQIKPKVSRRNEILTESNGKQKREK